MKYEEIGVGVFTMTPSEVKSFIVDLKDEIVTLEIFGIKILINQKLTKRKLFIHKASDMCFDVTPTKRFEFNLVQERKLIEFYEENGWKTPKERDNMFSNYIIKDIKIGEINEIALEVAIENFAKTSTGVEIRTKGDKTYVINSGAVIELKSEAFGDMIKKAVVGKTLSNLKLNPGIFNIIKTLGVIEEVTLEIKKGDISSIFG